MTMGLGSLMVSLKSKIRGLKMKKPYDKIEKSDSMRVEIRSRKAKKLIEETLKIADSPEVQDLRSLISAAVLDRVLLRCLAPASSD
ncbi:hypothetical protein OIU78_026331 [Salix suchowensis]|nr:hypothetical protein OIU78_026331 [Salix suchowensis]